MRCMACYPDVFCSFLYDIKCSRLNLASLVFGNLAVAAFVRTDLHPMSPYETRTQCFQLCVSYICGAAAIFKYAAYCSFKNMAISNALGNTLLCDFKCVRQYVVMIEKIIGGSVTFPDASHTWMWRRAGCAGKRDWSSGHSHLMQTDSNCPCWRLGRIFKCNITIFKKL